MNAPPETSPRKKKLLSRGAGLLIVGFWLVMMGLLFSKNNSQHIAYSTNNSNITDKESPPLTKGEQEWMEIFLHDKKIGYSRSIMQPLEGGYAVHEALFMRLNLLDRPSLIRCETRAIVDDGFRLRHFSFTMQSGATVFTVSGDVNGNWLIIRRKGTPDRKIRLRESLYIDSSLNYLFKKAPLVVGKSLRVPFFDPSTLSRRIMLIRIAGQETIKIRNIPYKAYRLETAVMGQQVFFWLDEQGDVLKESGLMGLTLVRSNPDQATRDISPGGGEDFYDLASLKSDKRLSRPRQLRYLKVQLEGIARTPFDVAVLTGGRQQYREGVLEIASERVPRKGSYSLPYASRSSPMNMYLEPEINIETEDPAIQRKAREIVRREHDPVRAARRLMAWVYMKLEKRPVMTVPSAREVLKTRAGDCNEHAVLLTAFLRTSGIPARLCAGLVYARGKFYYHAWTEAYVGRWISMDATLDQMPVDATHITLARGDLEKQAAIIALIGKLKIKVLDYAYD
jgi:hypothetical protein